MSLSNPSKISLLGCGWLGAPLASYLQKNELTILGTVSSGEKQRLLAGQGIQTLVWKLGDALPKEFFGGETLVLTIPPGATEEDETGEKYAGELVAVVEAGKKLGVRNVLYTSSTSVYGDALGEIDESARVLGGRRSANKVIAAEKSLRLVEGINLTILRLSGLVGGSRQPGKWFAGKHNVANGNARVNLVHRQDVIRVIHEVIRQDARGHTLNVCADNHPIKSEYYPEMARKLGLEVPTFVQSDDGPARWVTNSQLKSRLNFNFTYPDPLNFPVD